MKGRAMMDQILSMKKAGRPIRKIACALGVSRNTVRRYLRETEAKALKDASGAEAVDDQPPVRMAWEARLDWDAIKKAKRSGVTSQQLYAEQSPDVSYSRFCRVLRSRLKPQTKKGFIAAKDGSVVRLTWSSLLRRIYKIDMARCQHCRARIHPEHCHIIDQEPLIMLTLVSLGLDPHPPPIRPPGRTPLDLEFDQRTDYDD